MQRFNKEEVAKLENRPGNYYFYSKSGALLYVGLSSILKHRVQSYLQKDDFTAHPTKKNLRSKIAYFSVIYRALSKARAIEESKKIGAPYNFHKEGGGN